MVSEPDPQRANSRDISRIWAVMKAERTAFLVTQGAKGPHARPMSAIVREPDGLVWFLTDRASMKDSEVDADSRCALIFSDGSATHLAITAEASIVDDRTVVHDLWSTAAQAFYPGGPDDPSVVAIRVTPVIAELWDGPSAPLALIQMAAAIVTGGSAADMGHNVKAELSTRGDQI